MCPELSEGVEGRVHSGILSGRGGWVYFSTGWTQQGEGTGTE